MFRRTLLDKLMIVVPQEKYYGNPFKYVLENWNIKGKNIIERVRLATDDQYYKEDIEPAKIAHDIWVNMMVATCNGRHTEITKNINDFYFILTSVERFYSMGLSEREIKDSYYREVHTLEESTSQASGIFQMVLGIMDYVSREALAEHDHVLDEQMNNDVKDHQDRLRESIRSAADNEDLIGGLDGPDLMEEGDK